MEILNIYRTFSDLFKNSYFSKPSIVSKINPENRKILTERLNQVLFDGENYRNKPIVDNEDLDYYVKSSYALEFPGVFMSLLEFNTSLSISSYDKNRYRNLSKAIDFISYLLSFESEENLKKFLFLMSENFFANLHTLSRFYCKQNKNSFSNVLYDSIFLRHSFYEKVLTEDEIFYLQNKQSIDKYIEKINNILNEDVAIAYVAVLSNVVATSVLTFSFLSEDGLCGFYSDLRDAVRKFGSYYISSILSSKFEGGNFKDEELMEIVLTLLMSCFVGIITNSLNSVQDVNMRFVSLLIEEMIAGSEFIVTLPKN